jgi:hypothetical protein
VYLLGKSLGKFNSDGLNGVRTHIRPNRLIGIGQIGTPDRR